jgi:hypothetical protein
MTALTHLITPISYCIKDASQTTPSVNNWMLLEHLTDPSENNGEPVRDMVGLSTSGGLNWGQALVRHNPNPSFQ